MAIAADSFAAGPLPERNVTLRLTFFIQPQNRLAWRRERVSTILMEPLILYTIQ